MSRVPLRVYLYHDNAWVHIDDTSFDPDSSIWDGLSWAQRDAQTRARFWGGIASLVRMDTEQEIWRSEPIARARSVAISNIRYCGWDDEYECTVDGSNYPLVAVPERFILKKTAKARKGFILWEFVQSELDAEKSIKRDYQTEAAIRAEIADGKWRTLADTVVIDGRVFKYNATSTNMYLERWIEDVSGKWEGAMANLCPLLDALCRQPERSHNEWVAISRANKEA